MPKINSSAEFEALRKDVLSSRDPNRPCIAVCTGSGCLALGAANLVTALKDEIQSQGLEQRIEVRETGCPGFCERGPLIVIYPDETCYLKVQPADAKEVIASVLEKKVIDRLLYVDPVTGERLWAEGRPAGKITSAVDSPRFGPIGAALGTAGVATAAVDDATNYTVCMTF